MALYYNNTNIAATANVFINNQAASQVLFNNALVWKKANQLHPGQSWTFSVNQNDGGSGHDAKAYLADYNTITLIGGYNGSSAQCVKWVDITQWSTLSFTFSYTSLSYFDFRWGIYNSWPTNILRAGEVRVTQVGGASGNYAGTHQINVADLSEGVYILVYLYAGSSLAANQVNITNITLT